MKRTIPLLLAAVLGSAITLAIGAAASGPSQPEGFTIEQIRFDESMGNSEPTPRIPKDWKLVGVSNGAKVNANNLWFQGTDGDIYMAQGFVSGGQFIISSRRIEKLETVK